MIMLCLIQENETNFEQKEESSKTEEREQTVLVTNSYEAVRHA